MKNHNEQVGGVASVFTCSSKKLLQLEPKVEKQDEVEVRGSDTKVFTGAKFNRGAHKVIFQVACCSWDPIIISCDL